MALFGAPIAHEDHAQRACYAALHLRDELRRYADELRREHGPRLLRAHGAQLGRGRGRQDRRRPAHGLHRPGTHGRASPRAWSSSPSRARSTSRRTRRRSSRATSSSTTWARSSVKGVARAAARSSSSQGPGALRTRLDVSRARGFSRFVGRERRDGERSRRRWRSAGEGQRPGGGRGGRGGGGQEPPLLRVRRALPRAGDPRPRGPASGPRQDDPLPAGARAACGPTSGSRSGTAPPRRATRSPGTLLLLDASSSERCPWSSTSWASPTPSGRSRAWSPRRASGSSSAWCASCFEPRSARQPAVILIEDLHWIDGGQRGLPGAAWSRSVSGTRTLLLVNFRPEYQRRLDAASPTTSSSRCAPLGAEAVGELLARPAGARSPRLAGLAERIRERTGGQPLLRRGGGAVAGRDREASREAAAPIGWSGPVERAGASGHRAGGAGRAHRPAGRAREAGAPDGVGDRQASSREAILERVAELRRGGAARRRCASLDGGRVPLREGALPRGGVRLQASAHPGGGLRLAARRAARRRARRGGARPRGARRRGASTSARRCSPTTGRRPARRSRRRAGTGARPSGRD